MSAAIDQILRAFRAQGADAIGMSGLLVKSTLIMRENLEELNERGLADRLPVLLGGAALTRTYVERDLREVYDGRVFYGKDAFEGLHTMDTLIRGARDGSLDPLSAGQHQHAPGESCQAAPLAGTDRPFTDRVGAGPFAAPVRGAFS